MMARGRTLDARDTDTPMVATLRRVLRERGTSAREVSVEAGLSPDALRNVLAGKTKMPRPQNLSRMAELLRVPVEIFTDPEAATALPTLTPLTKLRSGKLRFGGITGRPRALPPDREEDDVLANEQPLARPASAPSNDIPLVDYGRLEAHGPGEQVGVVSLPPRFMAARPPARGRLVVADAMNRVGGVSAGDMIILDEGPWVRGPGIYLLWLHGGYMLDYVVPGAGGAEVRREEGGPFPLDDAITVGGRVVGVMRWL